MSVTAATAAVRRLFAGMTAGLNFIAAGAFLAIAVLAERLLVAASSSGAVSAVSGAIIRTFTVAGATRVSIRGQGRDGSVGRRLDVLLGSRDGRCPCESRAGHNQR